MLLGCPVSHRHITQWSKRLVTSAAPFYLTETLAAQLPATLLTFVRQEFAYVQFDLSLRDSYTTYAIRPEGIAFTLLHPHAFEQLSAPLQHSLIEAQWSLGRGQIYAWEDIRSLIETSNGYYLGPSRCATTSAGTKFALDSQIWHYLSLDTRAAWLWYFIANNHPAYETIQLSKPEWAAIDPDQRQVVKKLANSFAYESGANCFSTTLAAITSDPVLATSISTLWLHQVPFLRSISAYGYRNATEYREPTPSLQDAIYIWWGPDNIARHACYLLYDGIVLNKNAQAWYAPRQLVLLQDVIAYWQDEGMRITVHTRQ
jgi:hypothetical protein